MLQHPGLRVGAVKHSEMAEPHAVRAQGLHLFDDETRLVEIGSSGVYPQWFALGFGSPQVLAEPPAIMSDQCIGGIQYMAVGAIVLLELDDALYPKVALQFLHVRRRSAAEGIDTLVVVADRKYRAFRVRGRRLCQQFEPLVLKTVCVLELIDQHVAKA